MEAARVNPRPAFGVCLVSHPGGDAPCRVAAALEARGFDALFVPENSHVPLARHVPDKFKGDMRLLAQFYDPFVTLAACAARTRRLHLGTSVCLLPQRDPVHVARAAASLDHISGGRLVLGVAGGFIREAMANHGSAFPQRWKLVRERVGAMRSVWREASPRYRGELVHVDGVCCGLPAHGALGPPVWIGSNSRRVPARVAAYADGWLVRPDVYPGDPFADLARACAERGRSRSDITMALLDAPREPAALAAAVERGYDLLLFMLRAADDDTLAREIDDLTDLVGTHA